MIAVRRPLLQFYVALDVGVVFRPPWMAEVPATQEHLPADHDRNAIAFYLLAFLYVVFAATLVA